MMRPHNCVRLFMLNLLIAVTTMNTGSLESAAYPASRQKRSGSTNEAKKSKCFAVNTVIVILVAIMILTQFLEIERKSNVFSIKIRSNGSYAELQKSEDDEDVALAKCNEERQKQRDQIGALKQEMDVLGDHLRRSVEFLPLKDVKMASKAEADRTWFMSTVREQSENGNPEQSYFPSEGSNGKILCLKGGNRGNGTLNSYAFAWPNYLPPNSSLVAGLSLISDAAFDYVNPWHSMSHLTVAVSWRMENQCEAPQRFVLYHNGELVTSMGSYISSVLLAALDRNVHVQELGDSPLCFEKAVVYRKGLGEMSLPKRIALFDMIRCKARKFCNIAESQRIVDGIRSINLTLVSRTGARSFKNESLVASVVAGECNKVPGCKFRLLHTVNLSFCEQVEAMSRTDILISAHGAQLTNLIFMEKGSSVMEMFPKGWLEGAGSGQYVFHWLARWAGMNHEGTYRDSEGPDCPNPQEGRIPCFLFHKDRQVGHNQTFLAQWTSEVLTKFQNRTSFQTSQPGTCPCS